MNIIKLSEGERLFTESRTVEFKKEEYTYTHIGIIDKNGEMWTTTELDEINHGQIYSQYEARHRK